MGKEEAVNYFTLFCDQANRHRQFSARWVKTVHAYYCAKQTLEKNTNNRQLHKTIWFTICHCEWPHSKKQAKNFFRRVSWFFKRHSRISFNQFSWFACRLMNSIRKTEKYLKSIWKCKFSYALITLYFENENVQQMAFLRKCEFCWNE